MFCVREEPVVFLHKEDDYVPYTPRRKENLHENLHDLEKDVMVEGLELTIRKEVTKHTQATSITLSCCFKTNTHSQHFDSLCQKKSALRLINSIYCTSTTLYFMGQETMFSGQLPVCVHKK